MSAEPEQAMKRANARDTSEYTLASLHASDYQKRLAKRHPARWRLLSACSPVSPVAVTRENRLVTIEALVMAKLLRPRVAGPDENVRIRRWYFTGWGVMVREAGVYTREAPK